MISVPEKVRVNFDNQENKVRCQLKPRKLQEKT